jgi:hypothetical protein
VIANLSAASCSLLETGASFFSKLETSGYRLKPKNSQTEISPLRRQLPNRQKTHLKTIAKSPALA